MLKNQGGVDDATELADFAPGGCLSGGVQLPASDSMAAAQPEPGPIFVTVIEPGGSFAGTFSVPFGQSVTVAHGSSGVTLAPAFLQSESEPEPFYEPVSDPTA